MNGYDVGSNSEYGKDSFLQLCFCMKGKQTTMEKLTIHKSSVSPSFPLLAIIAIILPILTLVSCKSGPILSWIGFSYVFSSDFGKTEVRKKKKIHLEESQLLRETPSPRPQDCFLQSFHWKNIERKKQLGNWVPYRGPAKIIIYKGLVMEFGRDVAVLIYCMTTK